MIFVEITKIVGGVFFLYLSWRNLAEDYREERLISYAWLALLGFLAGGRVSFGLMNLKMMDGWEDWLAFWVKPGFNYWGGLAAMLLISLEYAKTNEWKIWSFMEEITEVVYLFLAFLAAGEVVASDFELKKIVYLVIIVIGYLVAALMKKKYRSLIWYKSGKKGFVFFFVNALSSLLLAISAWYFHEVWWARIVWITISLLFGGGLFILGEVFNNLLIIKRGNNAKSR